MHEYSFAQSGLTLCNPMDYVAQHVSLSMEFPRQKYLSGLSFPPPGQLPHPGIKPMSPAWQADSLPMRPHIYMNPLTKSKVSPISLKK